MYPQHLVFVPPLLLHAAIAAGSSNGGTKSDAGWWYHQKYVEQFPDKINYVALHLVGYILE
jgi:hypothetical protein